MILAFIINKDWNYDETTKVGMHTFAINTNEDSKMEHVCIEIIQYNR